MTNLASNLENLAISIADECDELRDLINGNEITLSALHTINKTNLVSAINELVSLINSASSIDDQIMSYDFSWSSNRIAMEINEFSNALENEINALKIGAPASLNTITKIANSIGNDPNFSNYVNQSLNNRLRFDSAQSLSEEQKEIARTNIGAINQSDIIGEVIDYSVEFNNGLI